MRNKLLLVLAILFALVGIFGCDALALANSKVAVCVKADVNKDGFIKAELADPMKDVQSQVSKSKKLTLSCDGPSMTVVIVARGVVGTGDSSYSHGVIAEIKKKFLAGRIVIPDGRTTEIVQYEGSMSRSWGHLAKKFREQVEDFVELNKVKGGK